jgi:protoheme IX farnesyltransferase
MGWSAAGGSPADLHAILLAFFLFLWQVPHFWLLMLQHDGEYKTAGLPVVTDVFSSHQVRAITCSWLIAASAASLLLLQFRILTTLPSALLLLFLSVSLVLLTINQFFIAKAKNFRLIFIAVNSYMLLVMAIVVIEKVFTI